MIVFFDTETNGLPKNYKAPASQVDNWPRIIQLAFSVFDDDGTHIIDYCELIQPDGWMIPAEDFWIEHGYSTAVNEEKGVPIGEAIGQLLHFLEQATIVVAHNIGFDAPVIGAEIIRLGVTVKNKPQKFCTMLETTDICRLPGKFGYKWPTLDELHTYLFGRSFDGAHDALMDVRACSACYFELKARERSIIFIRNVKRWNNLDFSQYQKLGGYSHSFLKREVNGEQPVFVETDNVRIGKMVDTLLTDPSQCDMLDPLYPAAKSIASKIGKDFGSVLPHLEKQISLTAEMEYRGFKMRVKMRLDLGLPSHAVLDLKVTKAKDVRAVIEHMAYDNQLWGYGRAYGVEKKFIIIYSIPNNETSLIDLGPVKQYNEFWADKILKFGTVT